MASNSRLMLLICLEISLFLTSSMAMDFSDGLSRSTKRFCGRMLTDSLALICDGQYGTIVPMDKRSGIYCSHTFFQYYFYGSYKIQYYLLYYEKLLILHHVTSFFFVFIDVKCMFWTAVIHLCKLHQNMYIRLNCSSGVSKLFTKIHLV